MHYNCSVPNQKQQMCFNSSHRAEMLTMSLTRNVLKLMERLGLMTLDSDLYEYLR